MAKLDLYAAVNQEKLRDYFTMTGRPEQLDQPWQKAMHDAVQLFIQQTALKSNTISADHVTDTPARFVKALEAMTSGCLEDPRMYLAKTFTNGDAYDEMVIVEDIRLVSLCAHHLLPIFGKVTFAYIPKGNVVGLSKIPRFIQALSKRPQVQEKLAVNIVDIFQEAIDPQGCAVSVKAYHGCMLFRGIEEPASVTTTTALRGTFKEASVKAEFLKAADNNTPIFP
jgi:GTP cyclohydrolase I